MLSAASLTRNWLVDRGDIPDSFTTEDIFNALTNEHPHVTMPAVSGFLSRMAAAGALEAVRISRRHHFTIKDFSMIEELRETKAPADYGRTRTCVNGYQSHATSALPMPPAATPTPFISFPAAAAVSKSVSETVPGPTTVQSLQDRLMAIASDLEAFTTPLSAYPTQALLNELARRVH